MHKTFTWGVHLLSTMLVAPLRHIEPRRRGASNTRASSSKARPSIAPEKTEYIHTNGLSSASDDHSVVAAIMTAPDELRPEEDAHRKWKQSAAPMYDWLTNHHLVWPSLACRCVAFG